MDHSALRLGPPGGFSPAGEQVVALVKRQNNGLKVDSPPPKASWNNKLKDKWTQLTASDGPSCVLTLVHLAAMDRRD